MILDPPTASAFIEGYKRVLLHLCQPMEDEADESVLPLLAQGRNHLIETPRLLDESLKSLEGDPIPQDVVRAIRTLRVDHWIYLRDTRTYSIFIDPSGKSAFAVLGLTQKIREIVGGSGVAIETGVVRYAGRYICDGLISNVVILGRNYLESFGETYRQLKSSGRFHATCAT